MGRRHAKRGATAPRTTHNHVAAARRPHAGAHKEPPMTLDEIRDHITALSGSGKRVVSTRRHGIYSTFTLPGLDDMVGVRDTAIRYKDFGVPEDLNGALVLDVGSNVGAMIFEAARRGAREVTGLEFRQDRVDLCSSIARHYDYRARFFATDFNATIPPEKPIWYEQYDVVFCCSVDEYIDDLESFHNFLFEVTGDRLYFESNLQHDFDEADVMAMLMRAGFKDVHYIGNGHSGGISRKRKLFTARAA
jgi:SAM-dependent methyltransferase